MSSKKNKKSKGVTMSLAEFTSKVEEGTGAPTAGAGQNIVYAEKKAKMPMMSRWADEEEDDGAFSIEKERILLPSAPRASRGPAYADAEIPQNPPFTAHLGNLPYDLGEEEIYKLFRDLDIVDLKLPRDQQTQRLRGFGYVDFGTREDLVEALIRNEQMMRGRPIRITLGTGQGDRRGGDMDRSGMRGGDGDRRRGRPPAEDDDVDDWRTVMKGPGFEGGEESGDFRRGPPSGGDYEMRRGGGGGEGGGGGYRDRGFGGDRGPPRDRGPRGPPQDEEIDFSRSQMVQGPPPPAPSQYSSYGGGGGGGRREGGGGSRGGYGGRDGGGGGRDFGGGYDNRGDRGDRGYGGDRGGSDYYRGGGGGGGHHRDGGQGGGGHYPASQHSRHHSGSSDQGGGGAPRPAEESTWRRREPREHTISQSSQSSRDNYPSNYSNAPHPPRSERSESPPMRQHRERVVSPGDDRRDDYERPPRGGGGGEDRERERDDGSPPPQAPKERKRLVLQPRTVDKPVGETEVTASSIFGGAKPVDTQKREREIEEKMEKLKVDEVPKEESVSEKGGEGAERGSGDEQGGNSSGGERRERRGPPSEGRGGDRGDRGDRDRGERPKQFRLLTRASSGSKEAYIELDSPLTPTGGEGASASSRTSRMGGPMRAPPPLPMNNSSQSSQPQAYTSQRFSLLRSDDKDRGGSSYRGGRGGGGERGGPRRGDMDRGGRGDMDRGGRSDMDRGGRGGGEFRRRDHDGSGGPPRGGGGRSFDRDHHGGPPSRGGRTGGYSGGRGGDDYGGDGRRDHRGGDDFHRGPPSQHHLRGNNQSSSIGSQSEERDRDSHSEPEDDRDMIRGGGGERGGGGGERGPMDKVRGGGDFSDDDSGDFTRVEHRRGRKSYNNRMNTNQMSTGRGPPQQPQQPSRGGVGSNADRW